MKMQQNDLLLGIEQILFMFCIHFEQFFLKNIKFSFDILISENIKHYLDI